MTTNRSPHSREGEIQIVSSPKTPLETLHVDHFGPLQETADGFKHIFVIVDAFTRFTWLFPVKSTSTKEVCLWLERLFAICGTPNEIVSDRGTAFTSNEFTTFIERFKIKHRKIAAASPWANGIAERTNRFLISSLAKVVEDPTQ